MFNKDSHAHALIQDSPFMKLNLNLLTNYKSRVAFREKCSSVVGRRVKRVIVLEISRALRERLK